jgi:hypothetical protein
MSQVQRVEEHKTPWARVLLDALVQPLQQTTDTVKVLQIRADCQRAAALQDGQRTEGVGLRQVNYAADFPG